MCEHGTKTTLVYLPADGCPLVTTYKFDLLTIRWHSATRKHLFLYPQGEDTGLGKPKKGEESTLITATTSVQTADSVLTNPTGKHGVRSWSI